MHIHHGWNCYWYCTSFCATVDKITLWKHYVAIYQEQNKCICEDVNAVVTEWWILEVLVGLWAVCCNSFPNNTFQSVTKLLQSTPGKSPEATNVHSHSQSFILVLGLTNMFQYTTEHLLGSKWATERQKLKFNKHALELCWQWTTPKPTSSMPQVTRQATWQTGPYNCCYISFRAEDGNWRVWMKHTE
jgi:hypothetical protein